MINFILGPAPGRNPPELHRAIFELGVRMNRPFTIKDDQGVGQGPGITVFYGEGPLVSHFKKNTIRLPFSSPASPCVPVERDGKICFGSEGPEGTDLIAGSLNLTTFRHETGESDLPRDSFGRVPPAFHPLRNYFTEPLLENNAAWLLRQIESRSGEIKSVSSPWGGNRGALVLTHDVDGPILHSLFALSRSLMYGIMGNEREMESFRLGLLTRLSGRPDPYWNFDGWSHLEAMAGIRSTFYVYPGSTHASARHLNDPHYFIDSPVFIETLKRLASAGWEIGIHHGIKSHHADAYRESRERLSGLIAHPVTGSRSHYWGGVWTEPIHAWMLMDQIGFGYDASVSPQTLGYRGGSMLPAIPSLAWRRGVHDGLVVFPTAVMDAYVHRLDSGLPPEELKMKMNGLINNARKGGLLVADWHVRSFCNAGAHRWLLDPYLEYIFPLLNDPDFTIMTALQAAEAWRKHCCRCWQGEQ